METQTRIHGTRRVLTLEVSTEQSHRLGVAGPSRENSAGNWGGAVMTSAPLGICLTLVSSALNPSVLSFALLAPYPGARMKGGGKIKGGKRIKTKRKKGGEDKVQSVCFIWSVIQHFLLMTQKKVCFF